MDVPTLWHHQIRDSTMRYTDKPWLDALLSLPNYQANGVRLEHRNLGQCWYTETCSALERVNGAHDSLHIQRPDSPDIIEVSLSCLSLRALTDITMPFTVAILVLEAGHKIRRFDWRYHQTTYIELSDFDFGEKAVRITESFQREKPLTQLYSFSYQDVKSDQWVIVG
jgi:hypothetical protein